MKTKSNLKILLLVSILLIAMCLFNTNMVQATDVKTDETKTTAPVTDSTVKTTETKADTTPSITPKTTPNADTVKLIPDTLTVKEKESEFRILEKDSTEIISIVKESLSKGNVDMTGYDIDFLFEYTPKKLNNIHKGTIFINKNEEVITQKDVTIQYSNSSNYNTNDKKIAEDISNTINDWFFAYNFDETIPSDVECLKNVMSQLITDKNVTYDFEMTYSGGTGLWGRTSSFCINLFRNDVYYVSKDITINIYRMVTIPENIRDTEKDYNNYALPIVQKQVKKDAGLTDATIELINDDKNSQWYRVVVDESTYDVILIQKENTFKVHDGITISSNANVTLSAEKIANNSNVYKEMQKKLADKGYKNIFNAYELKLTNGNVSNGLELTFDVGTENNGKKAIVLHKKQNGSYEEFERTVENGRIKVTVTELSPFMIAIQGNTSNKKLDNEPKTRNCRLYNICKYNSTYFIRWNSSFKIQKIIM